MILGMSPHHTTEKVTNGDHTLLVHVQTLILYHFGHTPADSLGSITRFLKTYVLKLRLEFLFNILLGIIVLYIY